jgi:hypothetical protein
MKWLILIAVLVMYVHVFNVVANLYFESNRTLTLNDIWKKFAPPLRVTIELGDA